MGKLQKRRSRKKSREATKVVAAATESAAEGGAKAAKRQKDLILLVRNRYLGALIRGLEMSRYVQSKNPLNLKYTQYRICFSEWSVAKRRKTDSRAAVRLRFFGSRLTSLCT